MYQIDRLTLGSYRVNCYLVRSADSKTCVVIDPGYEPQRILDTAAGLGLTVEAILLTHGHFDHVGGVKAIQRATGCPAYIHPQDLALPKWLVKGFSVPVSPRQAWQGGGLPDAPIPYQEGSVITLAGLAFSVLETPGHTPGSVCLMMENVLFTGDTLFAGTCGRTDLPGGSSQQIRASLRRLADLPGDYAVYPGHGDATTLEAERHTNPYMSFRKADAYAFDPYRP